MAQRSAEDVCIEYAISVGENRRITKAIGMCICHRITDETHPGKGICLKELWDMVPDRRGEGNCWPEDVEEAIAALCMACAEARRLVGDRKVVRKRLGAAKRAVEAVGKRVAACKRERQEAGR